MKRVPIISENAVHLNRDYHTFFVIRKKESALECTNKCKDIFCIVRDSYAYLIHKDIENASSSYEYCNKRKNECFLPSRETFDFFRDSSEKTTENNTCQIIKSKSGLSRSTFDVKSSLNDVMSNSACNNRKDNSKNNYGTDIKVDFNLKIFKEYLKRFFGIHLNSCISYVDNVDKICSVKTEAEFSKLWKLAKTYTKRSKGVLLLIDFTRNQEDDTINNDDTVPIASKQKSSYANNLCASSDEENECSKVPYPNKIRDLSEEANNNTLNEKDDMYGPLPNLATSMYSKVLTKQIGDIKLENMVPPDVNSQDFLNDAPPIWFVRYMEQLKKDIIKEVSNHIMINVTGSLNKCPMKSPQHSRSKDTYQCENQFYNRSKFYKRSKCNYQRSYLLIHKRRQYKREKRDMKFRKMLQTDCADKRFTDVNERTKQEWKQLEELFKYNNENDDSEKENNHEQKYGSTESIDNININDIYEPNNTVSKNETVSERYSAIPSLDSVVLQASMMKIPLENSTVDTPCTQANACDRTKDNEFRMNCSITEHQMLDKKHYESTNCCCGSCVEYVSSCSDASSNEELYTDYNFELVPTTVKCPGNINYAQNPPLMERKLKDVFHKENDWCFVLLPETSSLSASICIAENHFTANSSNVPADDLSIHKSVERKHSIDEDDTNFFIMDPVDSSNKCANDTLKEFANNVHSLITSNSSDPMNKNIDVDSGAECENTGPIKIDVNGSHASYLMTEPMNTIYSDFPTQHSYQAQTDLNDLTQSFHSHTTSITDNGVYGIRETNTSTSHDYSKHNLSETGKPTASNDERIGEQVKKNFTNKYPERRMPREEREPATDSTQVGTTDPVRILPETLVTGALHFANIAYGTAREAIVKMRTNSKEKRSSHARRTRH